MKSALRFGLAALVLSAAAPAFADEAADLKEVKACLAGAGENQRSCIGKLSGACQESEEGQTTQGSVDCMGREEAAWDAILNERYKAEISAAKAVDDELKADPSGNYDSAAESLKKAQRAWIAYRDAECLRRYDLFQSGTYRLDAAAACQLDLTAARALDINASAE